MIVGHQRVGAAVDLIEQRFAVAAQNHKGIVGRRPAPGEVRHLQRRRVPVQAGSADTCPCWAMPSPARWMVSPPPQAPAGSRATGPAGPPHPHSSTPPPKACPSATPQSPPGPHRASPQRRMCERSVQLVPVHPPTASPACHQGRRPTQRRRRPQTRAPTTVCPCGVMRCDSISKLPTVVSAAGSRA